MKRVTAVSIAALVTINCLLLWRNRELHGRLSEANRRTALEIAVGSHVPAVRGYDASGVLRDIALTQEYTLLLSFSPHCPYCDENWPQWDRLVKTAAESRTNVLALNLASSVSSEYAAMHLRRIQVLSQMDPRTIKALHLRLTPQTLLLDSAARVVGVWTGRLSDADVSAIAGYMRSRKL